MAQVSLGEILRTRDAEAYKCINSKRVDLFLVDENCRPRCRVSGRRSPSGTSARANAEAGYTASDNAAGVRRAPNTTFRPFSSSTLLLHIVGRCVASCGARLPLRSPVRGRPTLASAVDMIPKKPGMVGWSSVSTPANPIHEAIRIVLSLRDRVIGHLPAQTALAVHRCRPVASSRLSWRQPS